MAKKDKKQMAKKDKKQEMTDKGESLKMSDTEIEKSQEPKKGHLVCHLAVKDGSDKYKSGDVYKGKDKDLIKHLLKRGAIYKV